MKNSISIIIPIYNASLLLERCIDSVLANRASFDLEIIAIDDGSTDKSVTILHNKYPMVIVLTQENQGPAAARNKGIAKATGKYLAFLDADDYWLPGFLDKTVAFLEAHPEAVAVSVGQDHYLPNGTSHIAPPILSGSAVMQAKVLDDFFDFWAEHNHVCTGSVLMRTDIVRKTGGQRPELRITEDLEFWAYLATFGKWGFIPEVLFVSDGGKVTQSQGWWEKNYKRWASAPAIENWQQRIIAKNPALTDALAYKKAVGRIAKNLSYAMLLTNRKKEARKQIIEWGAYFPEDKIAKLMRVAAKNSLLFSLVSQMLIYREKHRKTY